MRRAAILVLALAACKAPAPQAPVTTAPARTATTVRTTCPNEAPELYEGALDPAKPFGLRVDRLCIYGADDELRAKVEDALTIKVGEPLAESAVRPSIEAVMKTKLVDDVAVGAEARGDGAVVYVSVRPIPRIDEIVYARGTLPLLHVGDAVSVRDVAAVRHAVRDELTAGSYEDAKVDVAVEPLSPGHVRLRVQVDPGPKWHIVKVGFTGLSKMSDADLRAAADLPAGLAYHDDRVDVAALRMMDALYNHGFLKATVGVVDRKVAPDGGVTLTWPIQEGDVFRVGKVTFTGRGKADQKALAAAVPLKPGTVFQRHVATESMTETTAYYDKRGKRVTVEPALSRDDKKKLVDVTFDVKGE